MICGHSGEARNLAEVALQRGFTDVRIVTWPLDLLDDIGSAAEAARRRTPLQQGHRGGTPGTGRRLQGARRSLPRGHDRTPRRAVHRRRSDGLHVAVPQPAHTRGRRRRCGSPAPPVCRSRLPPSRRRSAPTSPTWCAPVPPTGASARPRRCCRPISTAICRSRCRTTPRSLIISSAEEIDARHGTSFAERCRQRVAISYPAINTADYLQISAEQTAEVLNRRGLMRDGYVLYLSRLARAKGVDDLITGFTASPACKELTLVIAGNGPEARHLRELAAATSARRSDQLPRRRRRRREAAPDGRLRSVRAAEQAAAGVRGDVRHRAGGEDARRRRTSDHHQHRRNRRGRRRHRDDRSGR